MPFMIDDFIIDRIQMGIAESSDGELLYTLTQLSEATIETTAESTDAVDNTGVLVKRFWRAKAGTFTATNAMPNLHVMSAASGNDPQFASSGAKIQMPKIMILDRTAAPITLEGLVEGSVRVNALENNGTMGKSYAQSTTATASEFGIASVNQLTLPTDLTVSRFIVKYEREVESGVKITNTANKYPKTIRLTLKCLGIEPCSPDILRAIYIVIPSFQVSSETSLTLGAEATIDFSGDMQVDYCSPDKALYHIYMADEEEDE